MPSKKNAFIADLIVLLKKENGKEDNDTNVWIAEKTFKAKDNYLDRKVNYGTNMFGKNKAFLIYQKNIKEVAAGSDNN